MMGKKTRKILDTVEKILKQQEKMIKAGQETREQQAAQERWNSQTEEQCAQLAQMIKSGQEAQAQEMERLIRDGQDGQGKKLEQLTKAVSQHDLTLTDLIDSWEEIQEGYRQETEQLRQERDSTLQMELQSAEKRERDLLALEIETLDQFFLLEKAMADMPQWQEQMTMIRQQLALKQQMAGLTVIAQTDAAVNYDIHEVTEVRETGDEHRDATVAEIYQPGYLYQGSILRKAAVAAWRYRHEA